MENYNYKIEYVFDSEHADGVFNLTRISDGAILSSKRSLDAAIEHASENKLTPFYIE